MGDNRRLVTLVVRYEGAWPYMYLKHLLSDLNHESSLRGGADGVVGR